MNPWYFVFFVLYEIYREIKRMFRVLVNNVTMIANLITYPQILLNHLVHSSVYISIPEHVVLKSKGKIVFYNPLLTYKLIYFHITIKNQKKKHIIFVYLVSTYTWNEMNLLLNSISYSLKKTILLK